VIGFDECLGTATYDKFDETPASTSAMVAQLPVVVAASKRSSQAATSGGDPADQHNGRITVEITTRRKLDAL